MKRIILAVLLLLTACRRGEKTDTMRALALAPSQDARVTAMQKRTESGGSDSWVLLGRAWTAHARESGDPGFYLNADAAADGALALSPTNRAATHLKGLVLLNQHEFAKAAEVARTSLSRDADDPLALGVLSDALLELGDVDGAISAAQKMIDLKPNLAAYSRASHLAWLQGDVAVAKESIRLAIDAGDPRDPEPLCWVLVQAAEIFRHEGDLAGAEAGYDIALSKLPDFPPALVGKARVAMAQERDAGALLERALAKAPLVETASLLGDAREAKGDLDGAERAWSEAERIGKATDRRALAAFWAAKGIHREEAVTLALEEQKARGGIYTDDVLAWALHRAGRSEEARVAIDRAMRLGTPDAQILFHAGAIRIANGEVDAGRALVRKALTMNPKVDPDAARLLDRG